MATGRKLRRHTNDDEENVSAGFSLSACTLVSRERAGRAPAMTRHSAERPWVAALLFRVAEVASKRRCSGTHRGQKRQTPFLAWCWNAGDPAPHVSGISQALGAQHPVLGKFRWQLVAEEIGHIFVSGEERTRKHVAVISITLLPLSRPCRGSQRSLASSKNTSAVN